MDDMYCLMCVALVRVACCVLRVACCLLLVACCLLLVACCCLLLVACCLLLVVACCCLLCGVCMRIAYCVLRIALRKPVWMWCVACYAWGGVRWGELCVANACDVVVVDHTCVHPQTRTRKYTMLCVLKSVITHC
jgi:hypothetical protein